MLPLTWHWTLCNVWSLKVWEPTICNTHMQLGHSPWDLILLRLIWHPVDRYRLPFSIGACLGNTKRGFRSLQDLSNHLTRYGFSLILTDVAGKRQTFIRMSVWSFSGAKSKYCVKQRFPIGFWHNCLSYQAWCGCCCIGCRVNLSTPCQPIATRCSTNVDCLSKPYFAPCLTHQWILFWLGHLASAVKTRSHCLPLLLHYLHKK